MVTTAGYQSGAERFADFRKIRLVVIRSPTDTDLRGLLLTIVVQFIAVMKNVTARNIQVSDEWTKQNGHKIQSKTYTVSGMNHEIGLQSANGEMVKSWWDIENELPVSDEYGNPLQRDTIINYNIDVAGLYLFWAEVGLVPLKSVEICYKISNFIHESRIESDIANSYVMRDIITSEQKFFVNREGQITIKTSPDDEVE